MFRIHKIILGLLMAAGLLGLASCGGNVDDLEAGDCIENLPSATESFSNVDTVDCDKPHVLEVTGKLGKDEARANAEEACVEVSIAYIGGPNSPYLDRIADAPYIEISNSDGDIEGATCLIQPSERVSESFKG